MNKGLVRTMIMSLRWDQREAILLGMPIGASLMSVLVIFLHELMCSDHPPGISLMTGLVLSLPVFMLSMLGSSGLGALIEDWKLEDQCVALGAEIERWKEEKRKEADHEDD